MSRTLTGTALLEKRILTEYREALWSPFCKAIKRYQLLEAGDRVAVCISGGKDSMLMAKMMQMLCRHSEIPFEAEYLIMDPGYNAENRQKVEENARRLELPYTLVESDIFAVANAQTKNPCFLCARMRRGCLYKNAQALGCNKIALGHHFDDVIVTTVMAMFYGGQLQGMPPRLQAKNFPGMELIRPLYMVREEDIIAWKEAEGLTFIQCACRFTENAGREDALHTSKRQEIKQLIKRLREDNPGIEDNIFASIHEVQLDTMVGWKMKGKTYSFLDAQVPGREDLC